MHVDGSKRREHFAARVAANLVVLIGGDGATGEVECRPVVHDVSSGEPDGLVGVRLHGDGVEVQLGVHHVDDGAADNGRVGQHGRARNAGVDERDDGVAQPDDRAVIDAAAVAAPRDVYVVVPACVLLGG